MKLKYKITLVLIGILLAILTTVGSSYALWTVTKTQSGTNTVTTGCFSLTFIDTENSNSTSINLNNSYPISDESGLATTPYKFTLTNNCSIAARYELSLSTSSDNTLSDEYIRSSVSNITDSITYGPLKLPRYRKLELDRALIDEIVTKKGISINNTYLLGTGTLNPGTSVSGELKLWIDLDAPNTIMGQKFTAVVSMSSYATEIIS